MHKARQSVVSHLRGRLSPRRGTRCVLCVHGGGLPQVLDVVEDLLVAAARLVLHVVQGSHLALHLHLDLLVEDLKEREGARGRSAGLVNMKVCAGKITQSAALQHRY